MGTPTAPGGETQQEESSWAERAQGKHSGQGRMAPDRARQPARGDGGKFSQPGKMNMERLSTGHIIGWANAKYAGTSYVIVERTDGIAFWLKVPEEYAGACSGAAAPQSASGKATQKPKSP